MPHKRAVGSLRRAGTQSFQNPELRTLRATILAKGNALSSFVSERASCVTACKGEVSRRFIRFNFQQSKLDTGAPPALFDSGEGKPFRSALRQDWSMVSDQERAEGSSFVAVNMTGHNPSFHRCFEDYSGSSSPTDASEIYTETTQSKKASEH